MYIFARPINPDKTFEVEIKMCVALQVFLYLSLFVAALGMRNPTRGVITDSSKNRVQQESKVWTSPQVKTEANSNSDLIAPNAKIIKVRETGHSLESFVDDLISFTEGTGFEHVSFETHIEDLRARIYEIEFVATTELNCQSLCDRVAHAKTFFQNMVDAAERLKRFERYDIRIYDLLYEIIELDIRVAALNDSYGFLNMEKNGNSEKVSHYQAIIYYAEIEFAEQNDIPIGLKVLFDEKAKIIKRNLESLRKQIPEAAEEL